jgi:site-specific DNA-cytosine methylase
VTQPTVLHLFSGLGGGALGFHRAGFRSVGAFDSDPAACRDLEYLTGEPATCVDLSTLTPQELADACTGRPDVVFTSPPCKSFSGCLPLATSKTAKYKALSSLAMRSIWLVLEAWPTPPPLLVLENVPRIKSRGRAWLDQIGGLLRSYGYAVKETTHDCGEIGGLAQRRRRFLLVARHMEQAQQVLYEPPVQDVRSIGEVISQLPVPLPGGTAGGPMHRLPRLSPLNWVRLALIRAGKDWRDLPEQVAIGTPGETHCGKYGVEGWDHTSHTIIGASQVARCWSAVSDPRVGCSPRSGSYGVADSDDASRTVTGAARTDNGAWSVSDPRVVCDRREGGHGVKAWDGVSAPVIGHATTHNHPCQVADPRLNHNPFRGMHRIEDWASASHTVIGDCRSVKGFRIAGTRGSAILGPHIDLDDKRPTHLIIQAADGTWHRPMTTIELALLQGFPAEVNGAPLVFDGKSHAAWRQRIGNAVPPPAAMSIARSCIETLNASEEGRFLMSAWPIWVERRTT